MSTTTEQRHALCAAHVTLNGLPARVGGYRNRFATITQVSTGLACEWAWETVARIVNDKDGAFTS